MVAAEKVSKGEITDLESLSKELNIDLVDASKIAMSPEFIRIVKATSMSKSFMSYHSVGVRRLLDLLDNEDPKIFLSAIQLLAKILKEVDTSPSLQLNVNLESLVKRSNKLYEQTVPNNFIEADETN